MPDANSTTRPFSQVTDGAAPYVGLGNGLHLKRTLGTGVDSLFFQPILKGRGRL